MRSGVNESNGSIGFSSRSRWRLGLIFWQPDGHIIWNVCRLKTSSKDRTGIGYGNEAGTGTGTWEVAGSLRAGLRFIVEWPERFLRGSLWTPLTASRQRLLQQPLDRCWLYLFSRLWLAGRIDLTFPSTGTCRQQNNV